MPTVAVDGADLFYRIDDFADPWRPAETVLLHHAAAGNAERWRTWVPALARRFRVLRMDARGHGRSSTPPPDYRWSIERLAHDVRDLVLAAGVGPVHYVGASAGGIIGLQFAHDFPELTRSLTLVAATPRMAQTRVDYGEWLDRIERLGVRGFFRSDATTRFTPAAAPSLIDWFADEAAKTPKSVVTTFIPYMASVDLTHLLPHIQAPVLILAAADDDITPPEAQQALVGTLPNARLIVYPVHGHNIAEEFPDRCAADTLAFLQAQMRGIVFVDSPSGRRARVAGTDLDVARIIRMYRATREDRTAFYEAFESYPEEILTVAFHYYRAFPEEIDAILDAEEHAARPALTLNPSPNSARGE